MRSNLSSAKQLISQMQLVVTSKNFFLQLDESWREACEKVFRVDQSEFDKFVDPGFEALVDEQARAHRRSSLRDPGVQGLKLPGPKLYEEKEGGAKGILKRGGSEGEDPEI